MAHETFEIEIPPPNPPIITIPLYIYPSPGAWEPLHVEIARNPNLHYYVILNPSNGPGSPMPDAHYIAETARLRMAANTTLFGYVHMSWGERKHDQIVADISTWAAWAHLVNPNIRMDGIFLDEAPSSVAFLEHIKSLKQHARRAFAGDIILWTNPGVPVDSAFYADADVINACEDSHNHWMLERPIFSIPISLRPKTSIIIHDYTGSTTQLRVDTETLRHAGYCMALITTDSNYTRFSATWHEFVALLAKKTRRTS